MKETLEDKMKYCFGLFESYLEAGMSADDAWQKAIRGFAFVYHTMDNRMPVNRAAELALSTLGREFRLTTIQPITEEEWRKAKEMTEGRINHPGLTTVSLGIEVKQADRCQAIHPIVGQQCSLPTWHKGPHINREDTEPGEVSPFVTLEWKDEE